MTVFKQLYLRNVNFWIIVILCFGLFVFYLYWPWRAIQLENPVWQAFPFFEDLAIIELKYKILGSLFLVPLFYAMVALGWRRSLIIWGLCLVLILPLMLTTWKSPENLTTNLLYFLVPISVTSLFYFEIEWRARTGKEYTEREKERNMYLSRIIEAQENERGRIAREIHDDTVQTLIALANQLQGISSSQSESITELHATCSQVEKILDRLNDSPARVSAEELARYRDSVRKMLEAASNRIGEIHFSRDLVLNTVENLRDICTNLRPATLDRLGLIPALRTLAAATTREYSMETSVSVSGMQYKLPSQIETTLYRVVQEALTNAGHHSKASNVGVLLQFQPNELEIAVQDNGEGFDLAETMQSMNAKNKLGLTGMRERIRLVNGTLDIESDVGEGTTLTIKVPVPVSA